MAKLRPFRNLPEMTDEEWRANKKWMHFKYVVLPKLEMPMEKGTLVKVIKKDEKPETTL